MSDARRPALRMLAAWSPRRPVRTPPRDTTGQLTTEQRVLLRTLLVPGEHVEKVVRTGHVLVWRAWAATSTRVLMLERTTRAFRTEEIPWWAVTAVEVEPDGALAVVRLWGLGRRFTLYAAALPEARVFASVVRLRTDRLAAVGLGG